MSNWIEVTIKEFKEKREEWLEHYSKYSHYLTQINLQESTEIKSVPYEKFTDKFESYCKNYPEKVKKYKEKREALKKQFGEYSSLYNCPYYCVIHNEQELEEYYKDFPKEKKGEHSNYFYNKQGLAKFTGKIIQDEGRPEFYGPFIGIAFFIDQEYWMIQDKRTGKEKFFINADYFYGEREERSYNIVENGKDYI